MSFWLLFLSYRFYLVSSSPSLLLSNITCYTRDVVLSSLFVWEGPVHSAVETRYPSQFPATNPKGSLSNYNPQRHPFRCSYALGDLWVFATHCILHTPKWKLSSLLVFSFSSVVSRPQGKRPRSGEVPAVQTGFRIFAEKLKWTQNQGFSDTLNLSIHEKSKTCVAGASTGRGTGQSLVTVAVPWELEQWSM